jgi:hypothetical protein
MAGIGRSREWAVVDALSHGAALLAAGARRPTRRSVLTGLRTRGRPPSSLMLDSCVKSARTRGQHLRRRGHSAPPSLLHGADPMRTCISYCAPACACAPSALTMRADQAGRRRAHGRQVQRAAHVEGVAVAQRVVDLDGQGRITIGAHGQRAAVALAALVRACGHVHRGAGLLAVGCGRAPPRCRSRSGRSASARKAGRSRVRV